MDTPFAIPPDDVLAQPTRARLFELLDEVRRPAGTAELARRLELHPNGVRVHLERMEQAGLVTRRRSRSQRGRPPDSWTIAPDARPGGTEPRAYRDLGRWLARVLWARPRGLAGIESTGREIGREIAPSDGGLEAFEVSLTALGFQPATEAHGPDGLIFRLRNCPFRDAVRENQPAICALHRGITRGLLDELTPSATLSAFVPRDPASAGCLIELEGLPTTGHDPASAPSPPPG
ncbi:MAG: helix-turn-helix transcriptional regulator [Solirubrobacteraceae bacterium]